MRNDIGEAIFFDQSGNSVVEYAIIVTLVSAAILPIIHDIGLALAIKLASAAGVDAWWVFGP
jgi:Flp pilus assembly pilin Flp